jgi:hypothetical protein
MLQQIRRTFSGVRGVLLSAALVGGLAAGAQARLVADEESCPVSAGACTRSCWIGGCGCTNVGCQEGVCVYTNCCGGCSSCNGQICEIVE